MRLIADGVIDREGVSGLARKLNYSERHLNRLLMTEVGTGALGLARAYRAQTARLLIETTGMTFSEIAFAAGFSSIRQFNETIKEVFASTPSGLRSRKGVPAATPPGIISLRLPYRPPFDSSHLFRFLGTRAVPGIEEWDGVVYRRTLPLPHGSGVVELLAAEDHVRCNLRLGDVRDLSAAVQRCRRLLDLDSDPVAVDEALSRDPLLRPLIKRAPGIRIPGTLDPDELATRAVIGQQISVKGARTIAGRLVSQFGKPMTSPDGDLTHLFPDQATLAEADLEDIGMPRLRQRSIRALASALTSGNISLDPGTDRDETHRMLLELPGIGPWTASYLALRALGDPDQFMPTDLGVREAMRRLDIEADPVSVAEKWRPWRSYAQQQLWASLG